MKIINNTPRRLKFYFGDINKKEPEGVVTLEIRQSVDLDDCPNTDFSIQED